MRNILIILSLFILFFSCDSEPELTNAAPEPEIEFVRMDTIWNVTSADSKSVEAKVVDAQGSSSLKTVYLKVYSQSGDLILESELYDDGGQLYPQAGDVFAKDGVFRNKYTAAQLDTASGIYQFKFVAEDNDANLSGEILKEVQLIKIFPPVLTSVVAPDSIPSGPYVKEFKISVESQGGQEILKNVGFNIYNDSKTVLLETRYIYEKESGFIEKVKENIDFTFNSDSTFNVAKNGWYVLEFFASDISNQKSNLIDRPIFLENKVGTIHYIDLEDTLQRPSTSLIQVKVSDPQSLADVDSVYFYSLRPDSVYANNGNPILLVDNGEWGDNVAGDGVYSMTIQIFSSNDAGQYVFEFFMRDKAGNLTAIERKVIEVQ